jgi:methylmalonyl-CoA mutase
VRAARERAVAKRADAITGVSEFPNLAELPVAVLEQSPPPSPLKKEEHAIESLRRMRLAEPFEALRDASDCMLAETGLRPRVFLANIGRPADFLPRATFAKNFFEASGIEAMTNDGFASVTEMASAFRASDAQLACLCSSDAVYEREAVAAAKALAAAGARHIYLAGRMPDAEAMLRAAGVQSFIYAGCDALRTLRDAYGILGR